MAFLFHGKLNMLLTDKEALMYKIVQLTDDEEQAWKLYCLETKGSMSAADFWHELPRYIQENYLAKTRDNQNASKENFLTYNFITEAMLDSIKEQENDGEDRYILSKFDSDDLKIIKRFIVSFALREEEALFSFAKKHEELMDIWWKKKIETILK